MSSFKAAVVGLWIADRFRLLFFVVHRASTARSWSDGCFSSQFQFRLHSTVGRKCESDVPPVYCCANDGTQALAFKAIGIDILHGSRCLSYAKLAVQVYTDNSAVRQQRSRASHVRFPISNALPPEFTCRFKVFDFYMRLPLESGDTTKHCPKLTHLLRSKYMVCGCSVGCDL